MQNAARHQRARRVLSVQGVTFPGNLYMQPRSVVTHLEAPLSAYASGEIAARDVVLSGLSWDTPHWPTLAVAWLEQGLPVDDEIAELLGQVVSRPKWPQALRHRAKALLKSWQIERSVVLPGTSGAATQETGTDGVPGHILRRSELDDLREIARVATRAALENFEPIPPEWNARLTLGTFFDGDDRIFELYVAGERPRDAIVLTSARVNRRTKEVTVSVTNLKPRSIVP